MKKIITTILTVAIACCTAFAADFLNLSQRMDALIGQVERYEGVSVKRMSKINVNQLRNEDFDDVNKMIVIDYSKASDIDKVMIKAKIDALTKDLPVVADEEGTKLFGTPHKDSQKITDCSVYSEDNCSFTAIFGSIEGKAAANLK